MTILHLPSRRHRRHPRHLQRPACPISPPHTPSTFPTSISQPCFSFVFPPPRRPGRPAFHLSTCNSGLLHDLTRGGTSLPLPLHSVLSRTFGCFSIAISTVRYGLALQPYIVVVRCLFRRDLSVPGPCFSPFLRERERWPKHGHGGSHISLMQWFWRCMPPFVACTRRVEEGECLSRETCHHGPRAECDQMKDKITIRLDEQGTIRMRSVCNRSRSSSQISSSNSELASYYPRSGRERWAIL